jgi:2-C-methyl-D-erythritol 2,4-cyclodiphosphate synthase
LQHCYKLIKEKGYKVVNVDSSICLEAPKIKKYSGQMRAVMAGILEITEEDVSVKATTTEQLGFVGREEGLVAYATVLLENEV